MDTRGRTATTSYCPPLGFRDTSRRQEQTPALGSILPSAPPPEHPSFLRPTDRGLPPQLRHPDSPPVPARERQEHPRPCAPRLFPSQRRRRPSVPAPPESPREPLQPETPGSGHYATSLAQDPSHPVRPGVVASRWSAQAHLVKRLHHLHQNPLLRNGRHGHHWRCLQWGGGAATSRGAARRAAQWLKAWGGAGERGAPPPSACALEESERLASQRRWVWALGSSLYPGEAGADVLRPCGRRTASGPPGGRLTVNACPALAGLLFPSP